MVKFLNSEQAEIEAEMDTQQVLQAELTRVREELAVATELLAQYSLEVMVQQKKVIVLSKRLEKYEHDQQPDNG